MNEFEYLNHYELLGVSQNATEKEIKRAYHQQVARYHPDRYANVSPDEQAYASKRMQYINEAYRVLSKNHLREAYNRSLDTATARQQASARGGSRSGPQQVAPSPRDYQAELYEHAQEHLEAGRYMQAVATLRELQRINPFYRDSAALLSQAEAALTGKSPRATPPPPPPEQEDQSGKGTSKRVHLIPLLGGLGILVVFGIVGAILLLPQITIPEGEASEVASAESATPTTVVSPPIVSSPTVHPQHPTGDPLAVEPTATPLPPAATPTPIPPAMTATPLPPAATPTPIPPAMTATPLPPAATVTPPLPAATATPLPPDSPAGGDIEGGTLLQASPDFAGWAAMSGDGWSVGSQNGRYHISAAANFGHIWSYRTAPRSTNLSIGVDVQVHGEAAGMLFHFVNGENYLAFIVAPGEARYALEQQVGGQKTILAQGTSSSIFQQNQTGEAPTNRLVAHLEGNTIRLFINATPVLNEAFGSITPARSYGLVAVGGATSTRAMFDNLELRALPGTP